MTAHSTFRASIALTSLTLMLAGAPACGDDDNSSPSDAGTGQGGSGGGGTAGSAGTTGGSGSGGTSGAGGGGGVGGTGTTGGSGTGTYPQGNTASTGGT